MNNGLLSVSRRARDSAERAASSAHGLTPRADAAGAPAGRGTHKLWTSLSSVTAVRACRHKERGHRQLAVVRCRFRAGNTSSPDISRVIRRSGAPQIRWPDEHIHWWLRCPPSRYVADFCGHCAGWSRNPGGLSAEARRKPEGGRGNFAANLRSPFGTIHPGRTPHPGHLLL